MSESLPPGYRLLEKDSPGLRLSYDYNDPFEDLVGPFGYKVEDRRISFAFEAKSHHCNSSNSVHGGMLMTFADYAVCLTAIWDQPGQKCVTVSFNSEFPAIGKEGKGPFNVILLYSCPLAIGPLFLARSAWAFVLYSLRNSFC